MSYYTSFIDITMHNGVALANEPVYTFLHNGVDEQRKITFAELDNTARIIAANLQNNYAVNKGDRVVLLFCPGLDFIEAFLACFYAGAIAVPVNPPGSGQTWNNFDAILNNAEAAIILADKAKVNFLSRQYQVTETQPPSCPVVDIATFDKNLLSQYRKPVITKDDIAMLQYTSGTTSTPKGVMITHGNIMHNQQQIKEQITQNYKVGVSWLPVYHDMGLFGSILQSVYVGGHCIVMPPSSFLAKPSRWLDAIKKYSANVSGYPNFALDLCVDVIDDSQLADFDLRSWKVAASGGEPVLASSQKRFAEKFAICGFNATSYVPCYGLAESTLLACANKRKPDESPAEITVSQKKLNAGVIDFNFVGDDSKTFVSCGMPESRAIITVNPQTLEIQNENQVGEIWIKSDSVAAGYWNDTVKTTDVFNISPQADALDNGYYRTGDLGFLHDGEIYITGRLKDLIIIHGKNHYPGDIERSVQSCHEALAYDCGAVFAVEIADIEHIVILQELKYSHRNLVETAAVAELIKTVVTQNHEVQVHAVMLLKPGSIFKTSSGKVKRGLCKQVWLDKEFKPVFEWQSTLLQKGLLPNFLAQSTSKQSKITLAKLTEVNSDAILNNLRIWVANKLSVDLSEVDPQISYAALGLDSVDIMSLFGEVESWLGINVNPEAMALWDVESLQDIANILYKVWQDPAQFQLKDAYDETEGFI